MSNADSAISRPQFDNIESFALHIETIEDIDSILPPYDQDSDCPGFMKNASDTAVLMLTSGSTGTSKAVVCIFSEFLYHFVNVPG
jgi:acyl-CoA synthetase (AMP-forming)/AMP-acid ligase II